MMSQDKNSSQEDPYNGSSHARGARKQNNYYYRSNDYNKEASNSSASSNANALNPAAEEFTPRANIQNTGAIRKTHNADRYSRNNNRTYRQNNEHIDFREPLPASSRSSRYETDRLATEVNNLSVEEKSENNDYHGQKYDQSKRDLRNNSYQHQQEEKQNYNNSYGKRNKRYDNRYFGKSSYYSNSLNNFENQYDNRKQVNRFNNKREKPRYNDRSNGGNWRSQRTNFSQDSYSTHNTSKQGKKIDAASQRERLEQMVERRALECLVCCEEIKHSDKIWSCEQCYHIIHLSCTVAWAKSSKVDDGWRCPACQNRCKNVPSDYRCYCKKTTDPKYEPGIFPHSCGNMCMRKGRNCDHKCLLLCHPGPCPDCEVMVLKNCGCGATTQSVKCSSDVDIVCEAVCNKILECTLHYCDLQCHVGPCKPCSESIKQECFCGKVGRRVACTIEFKGCVNYECGEVCSKLLSCGNHKCDRLCHKGPCDSCSRDVGKITTCACGKSKLTTLRSSCLDPIPSCNQVCGKRLKCGQPSAPHTCKLICHEGECPPCELTTFVRCRCGHMDKEIPCKKLTSKADDARCEKKCTKKRLCGKHRCNQLCCIELEHICPLPCNHTLSCGNHRCDRTCHSGKCLPCMEASFEELYCECGASVLYPPVPCGTRPPLCSNPCPRPRTCGHEVNHNCHTGACPPCTILCKRLCYGKHEERSAIPCHQESFSCGLPCGKPMPCGRHRCAKPCHLGNCPQPCRQPCQVPRALCGHPCGAPCHEPPCPDTSCRQQMPITCQCGLEKSSRICLELSEEFRNIEMAQIRDKIFEKEQTVDISDIVTNKMKKPSVLKVLECTEQCKVYERNKRLAIGLQIRNPDLTQKLTPRYSDFMKTWAKKDPHFCQRVHNKLTVLVQLAKESKQKSRAHSFETMNRDKRHFIHEYAEHFGCETAAYDAEPNRNVVATAFREKSWLPSMSLLECIQRENGQRKVPGPVMGKSDLGKSESVAVKLPSRLHRPATPPGEYVDYFDPPQI